VGTSGRTWRVSLLTALIATTVAVCAWASTRVWDEAYGAGPPYYGRTTNMDKWEDPRSQLLWLNGSGLMLVAALLVAMRTMRRSRSS
jgi:hypothetical protein